MMHKVPPSRATLHRVRVCHLKRCAKTFIKKKKKNQSGLYNISNRLGYETCMEKHIYPPNKDIKIHAYHLNIFRDV
jgi:hypothetical protein